MQTDAVDGADANGAGDDVAAFLILSLEGFVGFDALVAGAVKGLD